jgi:cytochrome c biogenesis protein CcmG/thiol:disulfide interchange protein DsbE
MNTSNEQESEILWRALGASHQPRVLVPVHPSGGPNAQIERLKIFGLLAALAIFLAAGPRPVMAASQVYRAPKAPDYSFRANDGQTYSPDYLKGNVVLLFFWATWCPYCRRAVPHMNVLASEYANASFTIIGICGGKNVDTWHNYIEEHQMRWPQYLDRDLRMAYLFRARGVPNFFLIDKNGAIVYHQAGWDDSMAGELEKLIDRTLARSARQ